MLWTSLMLTARKLALFAVLSLVAQGCASESGDDPGDGLETGSDDVTSSCATTDDALFFHGMSGYGRELAKPGLCVPKITDSGATGFMSGVAFTRADAAKVVGGYSAGRLPLVRRLQKGEGTETTAIMLDPSYSDGARFQGKTGPSIVEKWLADDETRRFVLVYSPSSTGWREYAALADGPQGARVRVCSVNGGHLELPRKVGSELFLDTDAWLEERCTR